MSRCTLAARFQALPASALITASALTASLYSPAAAADLRRGDIVVADAGLNQIRRVDPATGQQVPIASGGFFLDPADLVVGGAGDIYVAEYIGITGIVRVDAVSGAQVLIAQLESPVGVAWDGAGQLLVTADGAQGSLWRVDPATGQSQILASGLVTARGLASAPSGDVYIAGADRILRVAAGTNAVSIVSSRGLLDGAFDIAIGTTGDLYIANELGNNVLRVDPATGDQSVLAGGPLFINPMGITFDADGFLLVANQGTFDEPGGIARVDPETGAITVVSSAGNLFGIALATAVPEPSALVVAVPLGAFVLCRHRRPS